MSNVRPLMSMAVCFEFVRCFRAATRASGGGRADPILHRALPSRFWSCRLSRACLVSFARFCATSARSVHTGTLAVPAARSRSAAGAFGEQRIQYCFVTPGRLRAASRGVRALCAVGCCPARRCLGGIRLVGPRARAALSSHPDARCSCLSVHPHHPFDRLPLSPASGGAVA
jgi:hypothetical protein